MEPQGHALQPPGAPHSSAPSLSSPLPGLSCFICTDGVTPPDAQRPGEAKPRLCTCCSPRCPAHCKNDQRLLRTDSGRPVL